MKLKCTELYVDKNKDSSSCFWTCARFYLACQSWQPPIAISVQEKTMPIRFLTMAVICTVDTGAHCSSCIQPHPQSAILLRWDRAGQPLLSFHMRDMWRVCLEGNNVPVGQLITQGVCELWPLDRSAYLNSSLLVIWNNMPLKGDRK